MVTRGVESAIHGWEGSVWRRISSGAETCGHQALFGAMDTRVEWARNHDARAYPWLAVTARTDGKIPRLKHLEVPARRTGDMVRRAGSELAVYFKLAGPTGPR